MRADLNRYNARFLPRLLDSLTLLTLSSLPPVPPFGISLSDPRWFLLPFLESRLVSPLSFSCNRYTFMCFFRGNCSSVFSSFVLSYRWLSAYFILVLISEQSMQLFLFLSINCFWHLFFLRAFLSSISLLLTQYCFEISDNKIPFKQA